MRLEGLTPLQWDLADKLWEMETIEECREWLATLQPHVRQQALVVMELMRLEAMEEYVESADGVYPDAEELIAKIVQKK